MQKSRQSICSLLPNKNTWYKLPDNGLKKTFKIDFTYIAPRNKHFSSVEQTHKVYLFVVTGMKVCCHLRIKLWNDELHTPIEYQNLGRRNQS